MSMTMSVGVVGPSHWSYMAKELAQAIGNIITLKRIEANSVPNGLHVDAREFFQLLDQYVQGDVPPNPPASANAYMIAKRAIRTAGSKSETGESVRQSLTDYLRFFERINEPRQLDEKELSVATSLQKFLHQLYLDGQSETYESRVRFKERLVHR